MMLAKALASASASAPKVYVEDVFSTWLYTGNGSTQTITNGIDLSGKGGLVWIKDRTNENFHFLYDTARGAQQAIYSNSTSNQVNTTTGLTSFTSSGFTLGSNAGVNYSTANLASWTFRKAAKFFDVVTYTGNGTAGRTVSHNLGSTPGCIILKEYSAGTGDAWYVWHRGFNSGDGHGFLNTTAAFSNATTPYIFGDGSFYVAPTSTNFTVGGSAGVNESGQTYVAYLFAHDAGGFGDSGNDSVVKCGSWTVTGSSQDIDLGWEPQWLLVKRTDSAGAWYVVDNMRGFSNGQTAILYPHLSNAEYTDGTAYLIPTATGFKHSGLYSTSSTVAYIAIRRGPMKTPTDATKVFDDLAYTQSSPTFQTTNFVTDSVWTSYRDTTGGFYFGDRLRGGTRLAPNSTAAEAGTTNFTWDSNTSYQQSLNSGGSTTVIDYAFRRAPGFFDVVAFTGVYASTAYSHSLGVTPEMIILKRRSGTSDWIVYHTGVPSPLTNQPALNLTGGYYANSYFSASPTSTQFSAQYLNADNWVAYLFATCPGVSKVGSYTGSASTLNIDCGFTNGARFALIKRTSSGGFGDWYVFDSARGIVSGNDPYLALNRTDAENFFGAVDAVDPYSAGFSLPGNTLINDPGASFIYLAIA